MDFRQNGGHKSEVFYSRLITDAIIDDHNGILPHESSADMTSASHIVSAAARVVIPATAAVPNESSRVSLGEGAFWDSESGSLLWIDILGKRIFVTSRLPLASSADASKWAPAPTSDQKQSDATSSGDSKSAWWLGSIDTAALDLGYVGTVVSTINGHLVAGVQTGVVLFELEHPLPRGSKTRSGDSSFSASPSTIEGEVVRYPISLIKVHVLASPEKMQIGQRFNDGKCDPAGRLWVGSMGISDVDRTRSGSLYSVALHARHPDSQPPSPQAWSSSVADVHAIRVTPTSTSVTSLCTRYLPHISISNGIVWSKDGSTMFYVDSPDKCVYAFPFDVRSGEMRVTPATLQLPSTGSGAHSASTASSSSAAPPATSQSWDREAHVLFRTPDELGVPDGITIDSAGRLWVAHWGGSCVTVWSVTGAIPQSKLAAHCVGSIPLPASCITSVAFGGLGLQTLYVTSASNAVDVSNEELAGSVFAFDKVVVQGIEAVGVPATPFDDSLLWDF